MARLHTDPEFLARLQGLRGGAFDIFGRTEERRHERQMIEDYIKLLDELTAQLNAGNHAAALQLVSVPDEIRGYGHVKEKGIAAAKALQELHLNAFRNPQPARRAA